MPLGWLIGWDMAPCYYDNHVSSPDKYHSLKLNISQSAKQITKVVYDTFLNYNIYGTFLLCLLYISYKRYITARTFHDNPSQHIYVFKCRHRPTENHIKLKEVYFLIKLPILLLHVIGTNE